MTIEDVKTVVVRLSDENKRQLLQRECEAVLATQPQAEAMLDRLRTLTPELASAFQLRSVALSDFTFRLLLCGAPEPSQKIPSYLVISYCWRDTDRQNWDPVVRSTLKPWPICAPMVEEILRLRESWQEGIWMDVPCIDQGNAEEKQLTIGAMDVIYRAARRLIVVLEDVQLTQEEQDMALKVEVIIRHVLIPGPKDILFDELRALVNLSSQEYTVTLNLVQKLLSARWFRRAWCSQEIQVRPAGEECRPIFLLFGSRREIVRFGRTLIYFLILYVAFNENRQSPMYPSSRRGPDTVSHTPSTMSVDYIASKGGILDDDKNKPLFSLLSVLRRVFAFDCSMIADRISINLNLKGISLFFTGQVTDEDESYWIMTALTLAGGDIAPLCLRGPKLRLSGRNMTLPSWTLPSWALAPGRNETNLIVSDSSSITHVTPEYIELDLFLLDSTPRFPSKTSRARAEGIIADFSLHSYEWSSNEKGRAELMKHAEFMSIMDSKLPDALKDQFYAQWAEWMILFLACSLDCSLEWILNFARIAQVQLRDVWTHGEMSAPDPKFEPAALAIIMSFGIRKEDTAHFRKTYIEPTIRFVTWMTNTDVHKLIYQPRYPV